MCITLYSYINGQQKHPTRPEKTSKCLVNININSIVETTACYSSLWYWNNCFYIFHLVKSIASNLVLKWLFWGTKHFTVMVMATAAMYYSKTMVEMTTCQKLSQVEYWWAHGHSMLESVDWHHEQNYCRYSSKQNAETVINTFLKWMSRQGLHSDHLPGKKMHRRNV